MKLFSVVITAVLTISLVGCGTVETICPTTLVRISDGAQIHMGMHRDDIENILTRMSEYDMDIIASQWFQLSEDIAVSKIIWFSEDAVFYGDADNFMRISYEDYIAWDFLIKCRDWAIANGISLGDDIQEIIDSNQFENIDYYDWTGYRTIFNDNSVNIFFENENNETDIRLLCDGNGKIEAMLIAFWEN